MFIKWDSEQLISNINNKIKLNGLGNIYIGKCDKLLLIYIYRS